MKFLIVGLGGMLGAVSRYGFYQLFDRYLETIFPYGTFMVNMGGSFLLGIVYGLVQRGNVLPQEWSLFLAVGFCGSFTTYSTFAYENFLLLGDSKFLAMLVYSGLSLIVGILVTYLGYLASTYGTW